MSEAWAELVASKGTLRAVLYLVGMTMAVLLWSVLMFAAVAVIGTAVGGQG
jgi:hypothetical protein